MKHLYKRNKNYSYRIVIPVKLKIYFNQSNLFIKSLNTSNKEEAKIIVKYLDTKLNYIKSQSMILQPNEIKLLIDEFKNSNVKNIISRNSYLSVQELDTQIKYLTENNIKHDNPNIKNEVKELVDTLALKGIDTLFDTDTEDIDTLISKVVQIKINALNDIKQNISKNIYQDITTQSSLKVEEKIINLNETIDQFLQTKADKKYTYNLSLLSEYCSNKNISNLKTIKHNIILDFRDNYLSKKYTNKNTINQILTYIGTFFNYAIKCEYIITNPAKDSKYKLSVTEKVEAKRDKYTDTDIQKVFDNIDLLKLNQKTKKPKKYAKEYELIIKIAIYSGMRLDEIIQLRRDDIKTIDNQPCFSINADHGKTIKNEYSIRTIPIHDKLLQELILYLHENKSINLFTISAKQFGKDYSKFKTKLGFTNKITFHSYRHTFSDKLKQAQVNNTIIDELTGHAHSESSMSLGRYSNKYNIEILKEAIDKVEYNITIHS